MEGVGLILYADRDLTHEWLDTHRFNLGTHPEHTFVRYFLETFKTVLEQTAAENGAKVHALGCTNWPLLRKFHFFSSDSSTWSLGERYGTCFMFVDGVMKNISLPSKFKKNKKTLGFHNKQQWFKAMQYAKIKM